MALHLYPQDTIEYGYLNPFPWRGGDVYGEGIITRQLSTSETITNFLPDGFTWHENIPYLIVDMEIDTDQPLDEDVSVYLTRGNDPEIVLGSLNNRLGYAINTPSRPDNYYGYSLRFECHSMCNTADIIPHISVKSRFIFNTLAIPYNHDIDLHITDADSEFEDITTQWEYNTNNKIYMTSSVNS